MEQYSSCSLPQLPVYFVIQNALYTFEISLLSSVLENTFCSDHDFRQIILQHYQADLNSSWAHHKLKSQLWLTILHASASNLIELFLRILYIMLFFCSRIFCLVNYVFFSCPCRSRTKSILSIYWVESKVVKYQCVLLKEFGYPQFN